MYNDTTNIFTPHETSHFFRRLKFFMNEFEKWKSSAPHPSSQEPEPSQQQAAGKPVVKHLRMPGQNRTSLVVANFYILFFYDDE